MLESSEITDAVHVVYLTDFSLASPMGLQPCNNRVL